MFLTKSSIQFIYIHVILLEGIRLEYYDKFNLLSYMYFMYCMYNICILQWVLDLLKLSINALNVFFYIYGVLIN